MKINKDDLYLLWYENGEGEKFVEVFDDDNKFVPPPEGFIYQHSTFPAVIRHNIIRMVQKEEVDECNHPEEYVVKKKSIEKARECTKCNGYQVRRDDGSWPFDDEWVAEGSKLFMSSEISWREDLVIVLCTKGLYSLTESILIAARACERCRNVLAHENGLKWGYPEGGKKWEKCNTTCGFCK